MIYQVDSYKGDERIYGLKDQHFTYNVIMVNWKRRLQDSLINYETFDTSIVSVFCSACSIASEMTSAGILY